MQRGSKKRVVIFGGGMAGVQLAKRLDADFHVVLVDPNDYFEIPMAAPRSMVRPEFADQSIIPYAVALPSVTHVRGTLIEMGATQGQVLTHDGRRIIVQGNVNVLCTGSTYANALVRSTGITGHARKHLYRQYRQAIEAAQRILVVGGGPIGVEVAGEISESYPDKALTLLEAGPRLLAGTSDGAAQHAASVLTARGVTIILGQRLIQASTRSHDPLGGKGSATTTGGLQLGYDLVAWCTGGQPNTGYMNARLGGALNGEGRIRVGPDLRVAGYETLFALGDITDLNENKMAWHIEQQVRVAARNIRQLLGGHRHARTLTAYKPQTGNPKMAITLGSRQGVVHLPPFGVIRSPLLTRKAKAEHMLVPKYRRLLKVPASR